MYWGLVNKELQSIIKQVNIMGSKECISPHNLENS